MATDTSKITGAADDLSDKLTKGGSAAKTLGAEIASAFNSLDARVAALEAGATTPPVEPPIEPPTNTYGKIENFNGSNGARFKVDGADCSAQNANKSHCLTKLDDYTLCFEARQGDVWSSGGYSDGNSNRTELEFAQKYNEGTMLNWEAAITVLTGPSGAGGLLLQCHSTTNVSPTQCPFSIQIEPNTDKLQIVLNEPQQGSAGNNYIYTSPQPIPPNQPMRMKAKVKMGPTGNGSVDVWWDDKQIVDFNGKVGATNSQYYWKNGIYRSSSSAVTKISFKNVHITTG